MGQPAKHFYIVLLLVLLNGCELLGERPSEQGGHVEIRPGTIVTYGDTARVSVAADTVAVDDSLSVTVSTLGSGSCVRAAGAEVEVQRLEATVVPLDSVFIPGPGGACTGDLQWYPRTAIVAFGEPGRATIRIRGAGRGPSFEEDEGVAELQRQVVVRNRRD